MLAAASSGPNFGLIGILKTAQPALAGAILYLIKAVKVKPFAS
jgi:hypothetical protein